MLNATWTPNDGTLPPLPAYQLAILPPLIWPIPDKVLTLLMPFAAYWALSLFFHWIDTNDFLPQYRLHTPVEVLKRNRVSRWEVIRDVLIQQVVQTGMGILLGMTEPDDTYGKEDYDVAVWSRRIRISQRAIPWLLSAAGINSKDIAGHLTDSHPLIAGALSGGIYTSPEVAAVGSNYHSAASAPGYVYWEVLMATAIYYYVIPLIQFAVGMFVVDTWQYFLHRGMHMNKWMYTTFHSRHHRLYVPYAYGALYNHPFEGFLLDTLGTTIAYKVAGMSTRQGLLFFTGLTFKTVDDHCGYALPWDPLQHLSSNNAGYHDIHHQSWGIKTNFSQPCSTFWDRMLGTMWTGGDASVRYERARLAAEGKVDAEHTNAKPGDSALSKSLFRPQTPNEDISAGRLLSSPEEDRQPTSLKKAELQIAESRQQVLDDDEAGGFEVLVEESREEKDARRLPSKNRRKPSTSISGTDSLRGLGDRVAASMHGRAGGIIGMESNR